MKKIITIALLLVSCTCLGQTVIVPDNKPESYYDTTYEQGGVKTFIGVAGIKKEPDYGRLDSVRVVYDKDGNRTTKKYYTAKKPE